jgi:hypothetical protein
MDWARMLAFVTGSVDQELLVRAEYLAAENRILKAQLKGRLRLSDARPAAAWFIACIRSAFIRMHLALLAGTDFFTAEVLTFRGLVTYYVLFFIHFESRRVDIAGITVHPDEPWMKQIARNVNMEGCGALQDCRYLLHDRDSKYTQSFRAIIASSRCEPLVLPARV